MDAQGTATEDLVKVFIRTFDKKAKSIKFPQKMGGNQLREVIASKLNIPSERLVLYHHGEQIQEEAVLTPNTIIHAIDLRNVDQQEIQISIKTLEKGAQKYTFDIKSDDIIQEFIDSNLVDTYKVGPGDMFLVYTGKQLNPDKTFKEELVENQSELICVKCQEYRRTKKTETSRVTSIVTKERQNQEVTSQTKIGERQSIKKN